MKLISSYGIFEIAERTLNNIDIRMAGHAKRVSYLTCEVLQSLKSEYSLREIQDATILALLHDIGAYKTADITNLVSFESIHNMEHAVYGALFLKAFSPLADKTDIILYHHLPARDYKKVENGLPQNHLSSLICLCDRMELMLRTHSEEQCIGYIKEQSGIKFTNYWVDSFIKANEEKHILESIRSEDYEKSYNEFAAQISITQEEKRAYLATLAYFIDFRSEFMVLHTITTVSITLVLAEMFGLDNQETSDIHFGALLHDIGKVATPVEILEKPGRLTSEEMAIMQNHVSLSKNILCGLIKPEICNIAVRHHEKLDGSGYPDGLCGKDLALSERIVAVADVTSALIRKRSYKEAFDKNDTLKILNDMADANKLCPVVVGKLVDNFDYIINHTYIRSKEIMSKYELLKTEYQRIMNLIRDFEE
ncbi:MAG: HD domain-containing protein [Oscillospiraceae bacterium]